jgi:membrane-associated protein
MIPGVDLIDLITAASLIGVALIVFAESGLLIGFFLPGDSLLFTTGFLVHSGVLNYNIHFVVLVLFIAAVLGDSVGYTFGRRVGYKLFTRPNSLLFRQENIEKAQSFYEKHGGKTIVIARFIPVVRTFAPVIAGVGKMHYKTFLTYNLVGAVLWAAGVTYLGYFAGSWLEAAGIEIDHVLLPIIALIILISVLPPLFHIFKDKKQRVAFVEGIKRRLATIFRIKK